jgi:rhodanese-related sulfurtransferase
METTNSASFDPRLLEACKQFVDDMPDDLNYITAAELHFRLSKNADDLFVLDNRTPEAYATGHIPNAINIWTKDLLNRNTIARLPDDKEIIVCCWCGHLASQLVVVLQLLGFRARALKYGLGQADFGNHAANWSNLGYPLRAGETP